MKFKISLSILVVFMVVLFAGFVQAQVSVETASTATTSTVTAEQVKAANEKFIAARIEYQTLVKNGAEKNLVEAAYVKYITARDEYQKLNQAAGNCAPGSGQGAKINEGKGRGGNGSCDKGSFTSGTATGSTGQGKGKGNRGGCR